MVYADVKRDAGSDAVSSWAKKGVFAGFSCKPLWQNDDFCATALFITRQVMQKNA